MWVVEYLENIKCYIFWKNDRTIKVFTIYPKGDTYVQGNPVRHFAQTTNVNPTRERSGYHQSDSHSFSGDREFHGNPSKGCSDISVWTEVVDRLQQSLDSHHQHRK